MWEISTEAHFSAAHQLIGYPAECCQLHGHNFKVKVVVQISKLGPLGFGMDFRDLKKKLKEVIDYFDHKHLNTLPEFSKINPTVENISKIIWDKLSPQIHSPAKLKSVKIWESETNSATYFE